MDTTRAYLALWTSRVAILVGLVVGGWLLCASAASADDGRSTAELARELIDQAEGNGGGGDIAALVSGAVHGTVPPAAVLAAGPAEHQAHPQPAQPTSSASGSAHSTPGVEVEPTTTHGGADYGPDQGSAAGSESNVIAPAVETATPAPAAAPRSGTPAPATPPVPAHARPQVADVANVASRGVATADNVLSATRTPGIDRTAPADRPAQPPSPPAPAAPGSVSSMNSCATDGCGQARGSLGVLATRAHAATPGGGWPLSDPRSDDATSRAAGTPTSTPD